MYLNRHTLLPLFRSLIHNWTHICTDPHSHVAFRIVLHSLLCQLQCCKHPGAASGSLLPGHRRKWRGVESLFILPTPGNHQTEGARSCAEISMKVGQHEAIAQGRSCFHCTENSCAIHGESRLIWIHSWLQFSLLDLPFLILPKSFKTQRDTA